MCEHVSGDVAPAFLSRGCFAARLRHARSPLASPSSADAWSVKHVALGRALRVHACAVCKGPASVLSLSGEIVCGEPPQPRSSAVTPGLCGLGLRRGFPVTTPTLRTPGSAPAAPTVLGARVSVHHSWEPTGRAGRRPFDLRGLSTTGGVWGAAWTPMCTEGWPQLRFGGIRGGRELWSAWGRVRGPLRRAWTLECVGSCLGFPWATQR